VKALDILQLLVGKKFMEAVTFHIIYALLKKQCNKQNIDLDTVLQVINISDMHHFSGVSQATPARLKEIIDPFVQKEQ
jgi:hypothetical protein